MKLNGSFKFFTIMVLLFSFLVSCQRPNRNVYKYDEVGKTSAVSFGTILQVRSIGIIGENTGATAAGGALAGAAGGTYIGSGDGTGWAIAGLAIAGGVIGYLIEQGFADTMQAELEIMWATKLGLNSFDEELFQTLIFSLNCT